MRQRFDLHIHSTRSDGEHDAAEIVKMLRDREIKTFSITDHDSVSSIIDMAEIEHDLKYIPGVEISSVFEGEHKMHILGYYVDPECSELLELLGEIRGKRRKRFYELAGALKNLFGIHIPYDELEEICCTYEIPGRPHIAKLMIKHGYCTSVEEAFDMFLRKTKVKTLYRADAKDAISVIKKAGGIVLWAHPKNVESAEKKDANIFVPGLLKAGIEGIEVYNSLHTFDDCMRYRKIVKDNDLLTGGGSDFHGKNVKSHVHLGVLFKDDCDVLIDEKEITVIR